MSFAKRGNVCFFKTKTKKFNIKKKNVSILFVSNSDILNLIKKTFTEDEVKWYVVKNSSSNNVLCRSFLCLLTYVNTKSLKSYINMLGSYVLTLHYWPFIWHVCFCTGHVVMVPWNLFRLHCAQHFGLEHLFNLWAPLLIFGLWLSLW